MPHEPVYAGGQLIGWSDELGIEASVKISEARRRCGVASGAKQGVDYPETSESQISKATARRREEANLQEEIIQLLHLHGFFVAHFRPGMTGRTYTGKDGVEKKVWVTAVSADGAGFPDLVAVHGGSGHILVIEVKSSVGQLSQDQRYWRSLWQATAARYFLARPNNWEELTELVKKLSKK